ncbi:hypothetical protein GCM10026988_40170 [Vibrio panuliri]
MILPSRFLVAVPKAREKKAIVDLHVLSLFASRRFTGKNLEFVDSHHNETGEQFKEGK